MTFMHASLVLVGTLSLAVPILLHLLMRRRPKHAVFPAMRFVQRSLAANRRSLQLRQWILLALRCGALLAAAVALARPILPPEGWGQWALAGGAMTLALAMSGIALAAWWRQLHRGVIALFAGLAGVSLVTAIASTAPLWGLPASWLPRDQEAPVAAVFLIDNSPRMAVRRENESRFELAQRSALELLGQLPPGSEVAVVTPSDAGVTFSSDATAAAAAIRSLALSAVTEPIPLALARASTLLDTHALPGRERFLFTDLTEVSWQSPESITTASQPADPNDGTARPTGSKGTNEPYATYVIDVGAPGVQNLRLGIPSFPLGMATPGRPIPVDVTVLGESDSKGEEVELELWLEAPTRDRPILVDGKPALPESTVRGRARVAMEASSGGKHRFLLGGLEEGVRHGQIRLRSADGLEIDNQRFFTVEVRPPRRVLVATGPGAEAGFLTEAIAPRAWRESGRAKFDCEVIATEDLADYDLSAFSAIVLLDPPPLAPNIWTTLRRWVANENGLAIFLGRNANPVSAFQMDAAISLLPGRLARQWRAGEKPLRIAPRPESHPLLAIFGSRATTTPWDQLPIYRHWVFDDADESVEAIIPLSNGQPIAWERRVGDGTVLTFATPISDPLNVADRREWNLLPTGPEPWPYLVLVNEVMDYLVRAQTESYNREVGEMVRLAVRTGGPVSRGEVFSPLGTWSQAVVTDRRLSLGRLESLGTYRVFLDADGVSLMGVSANLSPDQTRLRRIDPKALDAILGAGRYRLLTQLDDLTRELGDARVGKELFPWLLLALALILAGEQVLANRFYGATSPGTASSTT